MQYIRGLSNYNDSGKSAVTFGKFDGLHKGHQKLVKKVREFGEKNKINSIVCAFDMRPLWEEKGLNPQLLMNGKEQQMHLEGQVDYLIECPFLSVKEMEAETFIEKILSGLFHARYIVVGENFRFGHDRRGDVAMLAKFQEQYGYCLEVIPNEYYGERIVSSTYVKEVMKTGNIDLVNRLLSYPYTIAGTVQKGAGMGREIGYPTMDIYPCQEKILPPNGAYVCKLHVDQEWYQGVCNIGQKPTVSKGGETILSVHLFCYEKKEEANGKAVVLHLYHYLRPEEKFEDVEELKCQIEEDIWEGKRHFLLTMESRRALLESETKKQKKN